jgi:Ca-activated chloride channel family protein
MRRRWRPPLGLIAALAVTAVEVALLARLGQRSALTFAFAGRAFELAAPRWLWLLLALPWLALMARGSLAAVGSRRRATSLVLRSLTAFLLVLALAGLHVQRPRADVAAVALVDVSASLGDGAMADERELLERTLRMAATRAASASIRVVRFAAQPSDVPPGAPALARLPAPIGLETDLGLALGFGLGVLEPGKVPRLLLLSDGRPTRGDLLAEAERAAARGARVFFHLPAGAEAPDVAIGALSGPETVRPRASFDLEVTILASVATAARLRLFRDGKPHEPDGERALELSAGRNQVRWPTRLESDEPAIYRAEVVPAAGNTHPENDAALLAVLPEPRPRVLIIAQRTSDAASLRAALAAEEIDADTHPRLPEGSALRRYDLVVLADAPRAALPDAAAAALAAFVREDGGGLLVTGGPAGFGSSAYAGTRLEGLLPVRSDQTDQNEEATLALGLVIDRSGSMSGPKMNLTREAARGTAMLLDPHDLITVVAFDSLAQTIVRLQPASNRQGILGGIAQLRAGGQTNILPGLREAFDQLLAARARKKHVIVLSDGQSPAEGIAELVDDAAAARITVSAVGVGEGADLALLQMIASRGGGRFYQTRDPSSIPRIFTRDTAELRRSSIVEEPTRAVVAKAAQALAGVPFAQAPPLRGYTRTRPRHEAELLLATPHGDPLLARWQQGLGQVLVWTSDLGSRWAADWVRWPPFAKLCAQLARSAMPGRAAAHFPIRTFLRGERVLARIDASDPDDRPLIGLTGELAIIDIGEAPRLPAGATRQVPLVEQRPGRYEAEVPLGDARALLLSARLAPAGQRRPVAEAHGRLSVPPAPELLPRLPALPGSEVLEGRALLEAVAARTGGRELRDDPAALFEPGSDRVPERAPLRRLLLLASLTLFLAEIAVRRASFRRPGSSGGAASAARGTR